MNVRPDEASGGPSVKRDAVNVRLNDASDGLSVKRVAVNVRPDEVSGRLGVNQRLSGTRCPGCAASKSHGQSLRWVLRVAIG